MTEYIQRTEIIAKEKSGKLRRIHKMSQEKWNAVENYICENLVPHDEFLEAALKSSDAAGLPSINVSPNFGKLLNLFANSIDARNILEVGTLGAYSTIWMARALPPGGHLITLEYDPKHASVAQANIERAGLSEIIEVRVGKAIDSLPKLAAEMRPPFDLIFIDADKPSNADYFEWAIKLSRPGSIIIVDNVVRDGNVTDASSTDTSVQGVRRLNEMLAKETRVSATAIQTVASKGYDGFVFAVVL
jgi:predicted O-methyltransferase YrrM